MIFEWASPNHKSRTLPPWLPVIFASDVFYTGSCAKCLLKCARGYANTPVLQTASSPCNVGSVGQSVYQLPLMQSIQSDVLLCNSWNVILEFKYITETNKC